MSALEKEVATFEAKRLDLLAAHRGRWVLIRGDRVVGTFHCWDDALDRGYEEFGPGPFLVKQILDVDPVAVLGGRRVTA